MPNLSRQFPILVLWLSVSAAPDTIQPSCAWIPLDSQSYKLTAALDADALRAEDLAIRYADGTKGLYSRHWEGDGPYVAAREQCMASLFEIVGRNHGVTSQQVRDALLHRPFGVDLAVFLSFGALYALLSYALGIWMRGRYDGWARLGFSIVVSVLLSAAGVMLGEVVQGQVEAIRIGASHMSYRLLRIPWAHYRPELFVTGILIYWIAASIPSRVKTRVTESAGILRLTE